MKASALKVHAVGLPQKRVPFASGPGLLRGSGQVFYSIQRVGYIFAVAIVKPCVEVTVSDVFLRKRSIFYRKYS